MRSWAIQDLWTMRHETRFIKFAWKIGTQNLVAICTLTLRQYLEYFPEVHFRQTVYGFKALKVTNLILQTVCKLELKRGSYVHLKETS